MLKLAWTFTSSPSQGAQFLCHRFLRAHHNIISYHTRSSIWIGIKKMLPLLLLHSQWSIGKGESVNFWKDNWLGQPVCDELNIDQALLPHLNASVSSFICNDSWALPSNFMSTYPELSNIIQGVPISIYNEEDQFIWTGSSSGSVELHSTYAHLHDHRPVVFWGKAIWSPTIAPRRSLLLWRLFNDALPTDDKLISCGMIIVSCCFLCKSPSHAETISHLFWDFNTDGAAKGNPGPAGYGAIFRNYRGFVLGAFCDTLGVSSSVAAELMAVLKAVDVAWHRGWHFLWIECDSSLIPNFLSNGHPSIPFLFRVVWSNCLHRLTHITYRYSHIFREGNCSANKLVNKGVSVQSFSWWSSTPDFLAADISQDCNGMLRYRFVV
ncbi:hypothetical protein L1049_015592 [Liquidambar formosana]|uniref:RNase H type-1 domain-containing protein n=1 Tax=Liquidambar formosana TaxID=63359 RepID=A0AAP0RY26_LIQFO